MIAAVVRRYGWYQLGLLTAFIAALGLKASLLMTSSIPFHGDEAVVGLMARHILEGQRPVFYYGQTYMGSLDAYLVAGGFSLFGMDVWVIRAIQVILYLGVVLTTGLIAERVIKSRTAAVAAAWMMAVPTVNTTLYTTVSLGGYGEVLLFGNLTLLISLWIAVRLRGKQGVPVWVYGLLGWLIGTGFWILGLSVVFSIPALLFVGWHFSKAAASQHKGAFLLASLAVVLGLLVGASPWWGSGLGTAGSGLWESFIESVIPDDFVSRLLQNSRNLLLFGSTVIIGVRPPWSLSWLAAPAIPMIGVFWIMVFFAGLREMRRRQSGVVEAYLLMYLVILLLLAGYLLTPFGRDPSGRYFLPLAVPLAVLTGGFIHQVAGRSGKAAVLLLTLVIGYQGLGTIQVASTNPPGLTTQLDEIAQVDHAYIESLIQFLQQENETRGYSNYWISYPLAFLSEETLIFAPALPYRRDLKFNPKDDRYPEYRELVAESERVAYITARLPGLNDYLRRKFREKGITWNEMQIGDYWVFYGLSGRIDANELEIELITP